MPEIFIYNGTAQGFDTTGSIDDLIAQRGTVIPPGGQGHMTIADAPTYATVVAQLERGGVIDHATVASPSTFTGLSHSVTQVAIAGKSISVMVAPTPKIPTPQTPTPPAPGKKTK